MSALHTPGPWHVGEGKAARLVYDARGWAIADAKLFPGYQRCDEDIGNARLIAAAPDLLEACETFREWLRREEVGFVNAGHVRETPEGKAAWREWYDENLRLCALAQEQARAAITKATGVQK